jgi:ATP-dependent protease ClpP protease subunit
MQTPQPQPQRKKFKTSQDWHDYLGNSQQQGQSPPTLQDLNELRKTCYKEIEEHRQSPLLVYATKFLEKLPPDTPNFIDISDVDGFTDLIQSVDSKKVDVLLHSPGGQADATERIVRILRNKFDEVNFLIPHSAYSAATMLALSGNNIILHPSAVLGPIDPQINGVPARSIKNGFDKVKKKIAEDGPESLPAYIPLIEKYSIELLELCDDSEELSKKLVREWLKEYMFRGENNKDSIIEEATTFFSNYNEHLTHSRPFSFDKLASLNLKIELANDNLLRDLIWEAYILLNGFFSVSSFVKLYENTHGVSWGRQLQFIVAPQPQSQQKPKGN